ncbi:MAG: TonB-dependent receptor [Bryobacterales bacterium]
MTSPSAMSRSLLLAGLLALSVGGVALRGQGSVGTLNGTVIDTTGAVIPGATVSITNTATGVETMTSTTSAGAYTFPYVPSGTYILRASSPGFRTTVRDNVALQVAQTLTVNMELEVGAVAEEVTVTGAPPLLEAGTAEVGRYISDEEYKNWPIMVADGQRQIQSFIFSSLPGTTGGEFQGSINGGQQYSHEILIEGIPVGRMDLMGGNNNEMSPGAESVGEFKLQTGAMGAQYNGGQTAVANFGIKSGGNDVHGAVFYYVQNEALNANTYANNSTGTKKAPDRTNNYGYQIGGPVYIPKVYDGRNKLFFSNTFERTTRSTFNISGFNTTLPNTDFKNGDFSRLFDPAFTGNAQSGSVLGVDAAGNQVRYGQIYDPLSTRELADGTILRTPFAGNVIPQSRFSNVANNVVNSVGIVDPQLDRMVRNMSTIGACCPFFQLWTVGTKIDYQLNGRNSLSGYWNSEQRSRNNSPGGRYGPVPGLPTGVFQNQNTPSQMIRLSWNSTITPTIVNRLAGGYNRFRNSNESVYVDQDWASQIGVQNTSPSHFPRMNFSGTEWQGGALMQIGSSSAGESFNGSYIFQDDLTVIRGKHTLRLGYEYRRYWMNQRSKDGSGNFNFTPVETRLSGYSLETGHAFASFLLGAVNSAGRGVTTLYSGPRHPSHGFYVSDDFKVTPKLTLNLGLRWEIIQPFFEVTDRMSEVDLDTPNPAADGRPGALVFGKRFQDTYPFMITPRFGIAYQMGEKMVVRAGYGMTNSPQIRNDWGFGGFTTGFTGSIPINANTSPTGFADDPSAYLDDPYPSLATPLPNTDPGQQLYTGMTTTARDTNRLPYVQNWNFTIQRLLPHQTVFEAAYIGNKGTRLRNANAASAYNALPASMLSMGDVLREQVAANPQYKPFASFSETQTVAQALRPFPQYTGIDEAYPYNGTSIYHSMQLTLRRRFESGFGLLGAYTWSKTLALSDNQLNMGDVGMQDQFNRGLERSVAGYNIPHQLRVTWLYEVPFKGQSKALKFLVGGWTISGIHQYQTGAAFSVSQGGLNTPAGFGSIRPDIVGSNLSVGGASEDLDYFVGTPYLNTASFQESPRTGNGVPLRVGTAPRQIDALRGPHSSSERFRFTKKFLFTEDINFEIGVAMINPFNRHNREFVTTNVSSADFGKLRIAGSGQRQVQLEARIAF